MHEHTNKFEKNNYKLNKQFFKKCSSKRYMNMHKFIQIV